MNRPPLQSAPCYSAPNKLNVDSVMTDGPTTQTISSESDHRKSVPVVTVESFFNTHGEKLALRLEGPRVGFHRKIREPTINRPGLALSGFFRFWAPRRTPTSKVFLPNCGSSVSAPCANKKSRAW